MLDLRPAPAGAQMCAATSNAPAGGPAVPGSARRLPLRRSRGGRGPTGNRLDDLDPVRRPGRRATTSLAPRARDDAHRIPRNGRLPAPGIPRLADGAGSPRNSQRRRVRERCEGDARSRAAPAAEETRYGRSPAALRVDPTLNHSPARRGRTGRTADSPAGNRGPGSSPTRRCGGAAAPAPPRPAAREPQGRRPAAFPVDPSVCRGSISSAAVRPPATRRLHGAARRRRARGPAVVVSVAVCVDPARRARTPAGPPTARPSECSHQFEQHQVRTVRACAKPPAKRSETLRAKGRACSRAAAARLRRRNRSGDGDSRIIDPCRTLDVACGTSSPRHLRGRSRGSTSRPDAGLPGRRGVLGATGTTVRRPVGRRLVTGPLLWSSSAGDNRRAFDEARRVAPW
jgi:hypothetical protein